MLNWFSNRKARQQGHAVTRVIGLRSRCYFERLEDRAMLSASMGAPQFGHEMSFAPPQQFRDQHMSSAGMYAPPQEFHAGPPPATDFGHPGPGFGNARPEAPFGSQFGKPQTSGPTTSTNSTNSSTNDLGALALNSGTSNSATNQASQPTYTTIIIVITHPSSSYSENNTSSNPQSNQSPPKSLAMTGPPADPPNSNSSNSNQAPRLPSGERLGNFLAPNMISQQAAALSIPTAAEIATAREIDSSAIPTSAALDSAFQSYAARLLLTTAASTTESTLPTSRDTDTTASEDSAAEFIQLTDALPSSAVVATGDAIERERAAVDEVLNGLEDLDSLPAELNWAAEDSSVADDPATSETAWDTLAFSPESLDGLVMLRATGDANSSNVNLTSVADSQPGPPAERVPVETSIGFYQVMEMATDVAPAAAVAPAALPVAEPVRTAEQADRPVQQNENSSPKAAAALSATTIVGAMLWASQRPRRTKKRTLYPGELGGLDR